MSARGDLVMHGTASGYRRGCRCDECQRCMRDRQRIQRGGLRGAPLRGPLVRSLRDYIPNVPVGGRVAVTCWCEEAIVLIPSEDVGRSTESCKRPNCKPQ